MPGKILVPFLAGMVLALLGGPPLILCLRRLKARQFVSSDAPDANPWIAHPFPTSVDIAERVEYVHPAVRATVACFEIGNRIDLRMTEKLKGTPPGVLIAEAFMVRHHPQWQKARELALKGKLGTLRAIQEFNAGRPRAQQVGVIMVSAHTSRGAEAVRGQFLFGLVELLLCVG